jgi:hypothetical protein
MKLRRRVPDYATSDWVHSLHEGADPRFGEELLYAAILNHFLTFITGSSSRLQRIRFSADLTMYWFPVHEI